MEIEHSHTINKERIDSESYSKTEAKCSALLARAKCEPLEHLAHISDGNHLSIAEDFSVSEGVRYLRGQDISSEMMLDDRNPVYIPDAEYEKLSRSHIFKEDVLLTIVGASTGFTALVHEAPEKLTANCKLGIIRVGEKQAVPSAYLHAFLAGHFGQYQIQHAKRGGGQTGLILPDLKALKIARFSQQFEMMVADVSNQAHQAKQDAKIILIEAEQILLHALGLENWWPSNQHTAIKNFSQSFAVVNRLDAEYYQPKYDAWAKRIKQHPAGLEELKAVCQIKEANFSPDDAQTYRYIELADIGSHGNITGATEDVGAALPTRARRRVAAGDVVVSSIEGSLQSVALVTDDYDNALCSTGFYVVRSNTINPETLLVLFKSEAYQNLFKQACTGTILTAMPKEFFGRIPVPVIDTAVQQSIAEKVQASFAVRRQSQQLLELAKQTVERAIESSEADALDWLQAQLHQSGLGVLK